MKPASLNELKKELQLFHPDRLLELCLQLSKLRKENKEFLSYLLFDADDELQFITDVKNEIDGLFSEMNVTTVFFAKKTLRKVLREIVKYGRFSGSKRVEVELLLHFCKKMKSTKLPVRSSPVLLNMYLRQLEKCRKLIPQLHEDLQYDLSQELDQLLIR